MPSVADFQMYFNIAFFSILGLGFLIGLLKGFRKALWSFLVNLIFVVFFFYTIDMIVNLLWVTEVAALGEQLSAVDPAFAGVTSLSEALPKALELYLPPEYLAAASNENLLELLSSISMFVLKIVYTILYFTVVQILYRLTLWIVKAIVTPSKKKSDKYRTKNAGLGGVLGLLQGGISLYITLIIFGGIISIGNSFTNLIPEEAPVQANQVSLRQGFPSANDPLVNYESALEMPDIEGIDEASELLNNMINAYESNPVVTFNNQVTIQNPNDLEEQMPLNLYLFDSVLSMNYKEERIAIRQEIEVLSEIASDVFNSDFMSTSNLSDIQASEIRSIFGKISDSSLITSLLPVGIEVASEVFEVPLEIPVSEVYEIDWDTELSQLGEVVAIGFDIVNAAGALEGDVDLETVVLDGEDVGDLFKSLGQSELVTLAAYVAIDPILAAAGETATALITVPVDMDWTAEFNAIGALASSVLNAGLTVGAVTEGDVGEILTVLSDVDFTIIMNSKLITNAMINILSGSVESIPISQYITVPANIQWLNTIDGDTVIYGEIYNILQAVNALANSASGIDFDSFQNLSINTLSQFTAGDINALFESTILRATITDYVRGADLGDAFTILMPDTVFDAEGYIIKTELQNVVSAALMLVTELSCDLDDTACQEIGVDINKVFTLNSANMDTLLASEVLHASVGNLVLTMGGEFLTVPGTAKESVNVETIATEIVTKLEIKNAFLAISTLGITDINDLDIDPSILTNLADDSDPTLLDPNKANTLFGSKILNATLSQYLLDFASGPEALVVVPYVAENGVTPIREIDPIDSTEYISQAELTNVLQAVLSLNITDFNTLDSITIETILSNIDDLLASSILQATVSKQLLDYDELIVVPLNDQGGLPLKLTVGLTGQETTYIASGELTKTFDAISALGITDVNNLEMSTAILNNLAVEGDPTELDNTKTTRLFSSSIINATLSKYLIDFTDGGMVVVPWEDELGTPIRTVDAADSTEYISQTELTEVLEAVLKLDITNFEAMDGINLDNIINNFDELLDSAILHATISKQIIDLSTGVVIVPEVREDNITEVLVSQGDPGFETTYIESSELQALFDSLKVLGLTDIDGFSGGAFDLTTLGAPGATTTLSSSAIIQATVSKQVLDLVGTATATTLIIVPYETPDGLTDLRKTVGATVQTEMIVQAEIKNLLDAFVALGLTDIDNAMDAISIDSLSTNAATIFESYIIQATVSKQVIDLESAMIVVPHWSDNLLTPEQLRFTSGDPLVLETEYIEKQELIHLMQALDVLVPAGQGVEGFSSGAISLSLFYDLGPRTILLNSFIMQASISKQIIDLGGAAIEVPNYEFDEVTPVKLTAGSGLEQTEYITDTELHDLFEALELLGLGDVSGFDASTLSFAMFMPSLDVDYDTNQSTLLASACIQATMSSQVVDLGAMIQVPTHDFSNTVIHVQHASGTDYVTVTELKHLFNALDMLGFSDINEFNGTLALGALFENSDPLFDTNQDVVLDSAIMHRTFTKQIADMDGTELVVPTLDIDGNNVDITQTGNFFILKTEIKDLLNAMNEIGFTGNLSGFSGTINLSTLGNSSSQDTLLYSAIMHATLTDKLLPTSLVIPDTDLNRLVLGNPVDIRVTQATVPFIEKVEMKALLTSLHLLGLTNYNDMSVNLGTALAQDQAIILDSAIIQATISDNFLSTAKLYPAAASGEFVVAQHHREAITVETLAAEWIEINELEAIMIALNPDNLNLTSFNVSFTGNILNGKNDTQLNTIFNSASMHLTVENMIKKNGDLNSYVPDITGQVVIQDSLFSLTNIITKAETINFVKAINTFGGDLTGTFDVNSLNLLTPAQRLTVIQSAIARCKLTSDFENLMTLNGTPYGPSDYEVLDTAGNACLTYSAAQQALALL